MIPSKDELLKIGVRLSTDDLPGIGGYIKDRPEDFVVDEVPLYEASGEGEHMILKIKKRRTASFEVVKQLAKALDLASRDIGYAGVKDKNALTTQYMSVPCRDEAKIKALSFRDFSIEEMHPHKNKIKLGHLLANRFTITIRDILPNSQELLLKKLKRLEEFGCPNYYHLQRFGNRRNSHLTGLAVLRNDFKLACDYIIGDDSEFEPSSQARAARKLYDEGQLGAALHRYPKYLFAEKRMLKELVKGDDRHKRAYLKYDRRLREFFFTAAQSYLFNIYLNRKLDNLGLMQVGDVALVARNHAPFIVEDAEIETQRLASGEILASGPLPGTKMVSPSGESLKLEDSVYEELGLDRNLFDATPEGVRFKGDRRPLTIPIKDLAYEFAEETNLKLSFELPPGAYATMLLSEICL